VLSAMFAFRRDDAIVSANQEVSPETKHTGEVAPA